VSQGADDATVHEQAPVVWTTTDELPPPAGIDRDDGANA
jgi:hypothetical protein